MLFYPSLVILLRKVVVAVVVLDVVVSYCYHYHYHYHHYLLWLLMILDVYYFYFYLSPSYVSSTAPRYLVGWFDIPYKISLVSELAAKREAYCTEQYTDSIDSSRLYRARASKWGTNF